MSRSLQSCVWVLGAVALGCGTARQVRHAPSAELLAKSQGAVAKGPERHHWMPGWAKHRDAEEPLPDGGAEVIVRGLRVAYGPKGQVARARDLLPLGSVRVIKLPPRLGGGVLFWVRRGSGKLYRAASFLGPLEPVGRFSRRVDEIVPGPDRVFVRYGGKVYYDGLELSKKRLVPQMGLPDVGPLASVGFSSGWRGAAVVPMLGVLLTNDAGASWNLLKGTTGRYEVRGRPGSLRLRKPGGGFVEIPTQGPLKAVPNWPTKKAKRPPLELGKEPLDLAIRRGFPLSDGSALVALEGDLLRISLDNGRVIERLRKRYPSSEGEVCRAIAYGKGVGLLCSGGKGVGTQLYAVGKAYRLSPAKRYSQPRSFYPTGKGALHITGACDPTAKVKAGQYCALFGDGSERLVRTQGDVGVESVVALSTKEVAIVVPPRGNDPGALTVLPQNRSQKPRSFALKASGDTDDLGIDLGTSVFAKTWTEAPKREIAGWLLSGGRYIGVRIKLDTGEMSFGSHPPVGVVMPRAGLHAMTSVHGDQYATSDDGGLSWTTWTAPPPMAGNLARGRLIHCTRVGCVLPFRKGNWYRVGWGSDRAPSDFADAPKTKLLSSRFVAPPIAHFQCEGKWGKTQERLEKPARESINQRMVRLAQASTQAPWLYRKNTPKIPDSYELYAKEINNLDGLFYAWAPKGLERSGGVRFGVHFRDSRSAHHRLAKTAPTSAPWTDSLELNDALFGGGFSGAVGLFGYADPGGNAALVARCMTSEPCDFYGAVDGRPLERLAPLNRAPLSRLGRLQGSAAYVDGAYYLLTRRNESVWLTRFSRRSSRRLKTYYLPRRAYGERLQLVRRKRGKGLAIVAQGWDPRSRRQVYLIPVNPRTGNLGTPEPLYERADLSMGLKLCDKDANGWLVNDHHAFRAQAHYKNGQLHTRSLRMMLLAQPKRVCVAGLSALPLAALAQGKKGGGRRAKRGKNKLGAGPSIPFGTAGLGRSFVPSLGGRCTTCASW